MKRFCTWIINLFASGHRHEYDLETAECECGKICGDW